MSLAIRLGLAGVLASAATLAIAPHAHADVTISFDATQNMNCTAGVCEPTATDAVLNVSDLEGYLASGNVEVTTTGSGVQANNIQVAAPFSWSATNTLTLDAYQSATVDATISANGLTGFYITTNDGGTDGLLSFGQKGNIKFGNLSSSLSINGNSYTLVDTLGSLGAAISANPEGNFAFARDYDAKSGAGNISTQYGGTFDGLGNTISNVTFKLHGGYASIAIFDDVESGTVADIRLSNIQMTGAECEYCALLVGTVVDGKIEGDSVSGTISLRKGSAGGLVGFNNNGQVSRSSSDAVVNCRRGSVAGLVLQNDGTISGSFASGTVSGNVSAGGLVGFNAGQIASSYAASSIVIAKGSRHYSGYVGGFAGSNTGSIVNSYATGSISAGDEPTDADVGGLVGANGSAATINDSYSTGHVSVSGGGLVGGSIGYNQAPEGSIGDIYWDKKTSGTSVGVGQGDDHGVTGLTTKVLKAGLPIGFDPAIWGEQKGINHGFPYLIAVPPKWRLRREVPTNLHDSGLARFPIHSSSGRTEYCLGMSSYCYVSLPPRGAVRYRIDRGTVVRVARTWGDSLRTARGQLAQP